MKIRFLNLQSIKSYCDGRESWQLCRTLLEKYAQEEQELKIEKADSHIDGMAN